MLPKKVSNSWPKGLDNPGCYPATVRLSSWPLSSSLCCLLIVDNKLITIMAS